MIDIHSHILPGLDDGPPDLQTALKTAKIAVKDGTTAIIATPHCMDGKFNCQAQDILDACEHFNQRLVNRRIGLTVLPGAEIRFTPDLIDSFNRGELLTLDNSGKALLIELPERCIIEAVANVVENLAEKGVRAIIAHPERNSTIQSQPEVIDVLRYSGAQFQITGDSLIGKFGRKTMKVAEKLVIMGNVHFLASDSHSPQFRSPRRTKALKKKKKLVGK
ncbi:MAG: tyrosine protein phosphatase, partial [Desulfobulbaceae bacterium]|nr:tyrosine protein phosphatase [Desulfobulbaceae bacterium]